MYVVILGAGRVGLMLARQLVDEGKNVAIVEKDSLKAKEALNLLDCLVVTGSGTDVGVLKKAGIQKASTFVSVSDSDELNLIACGIVSAEFPSVVTIARVRNLGYGETRLMTESIMGIDHIINPDIEAAGAITLALEHGARSDIMLFENTGFQMRDLFLGKESFFVGRTLQQVRQECNIEFLVAVVIRDNSYIIPEGSTVLQENDRIYMLSDGKNFETIFSKENIKNRKLDKIVIVGGGTIGELVVEKILDNEKLMSGFFGTIQKVLKRGKKKIHIIDKDYERCKFLAEKFPSVLVTCQDIMNEGVLEDQDILKADLIVTTTNNYELNIITGSYAKTLGIPRTIALVIKRSYRHMAHNLNLDVTISRNNTVVNSILKVVRKGNIKNVYGISGGKLEVIEFSLSNQSRMIGKRLKDIKFPDKSLMLFITRDNESIIPYGSLRIEENDHFAFITERESIKKLENLIAG